MSTFDVALFVAGFLTCEAIVIVFALSACRLAGAADDAADQALHDLTNADRIWREDTALKAINTEGRN